MKHYKFMYVLMMMVFILTLVSGQMILGIIHHSKGSRNADVDRTIRK